MATKLRDGEMESPHTDTPQSRHSSTHSSTASAPMSKCNKSALISLERELKNNVNTDELIDMLEEPAGGFMTEREKMSVYEQPNQREKVGRIITLLRGKGDRDFDIFIQLLKDSGNAVWARQLEEKADDFRNIIARRTMNSRTSNSDLESDLLCKVVLLGDSGVGKSSLISSFAGEDFNSSITATIGVDFKTRLIEIDSKLIKAYIWDPAGQERFNSITTTYYREIDGAIIVYDMTKQSTFSAVDIWLSDLRKYADPDIVTMLVGNKCDEEQQAVSTVEARTYSKTNSMLFYETSAKNSTNVDDAFYAFVQAIYETRQLLAKHPPRQPTNTVAVDQPNAAFTLEGDQPSVALGVSQSTNTPAVAQQPRQRKKCCNRN